MSRAQMLGVLAVCCPAIAFADEVIEPGYIAAMFVQSESVSDTELSRISGKSNTAVLDDERVAVILWDERGSGSRRDTVRLVNGNPGAQSITLTVIRK
jgi:hypothetical protein